MIQSSGNFFKIFISFKSRGGLRLGQVRSDASSLGQTLENFVYAVESTVLYPYETLSEC